MGDAVCQAEDMISRGIDGAIMGQYGTDHSDLGRTAVVFRNAAESQSGFKFVSSEDKGTQKNCRRESACDLTRQLIKDLDYAYDHFQKAPRISVRMTAPWFSFSM